MEFKCFFFSFIVSLNTGTPFAQQEAAAAACLAT
jgi:hypothetical protein